MTFHRTEKVIVTGSGNPILAGSVRVDSCLGEYYTPKYPDGIGRG